MFGVSRRTPGRGSSGLNAHCPAGRTRDKRSHAAIEGWGVVRIWRLPPLSGLDDSHNKKDGEETPGDRHLTPRGW